MTWSLSRTTFNRNIAVVIGINNYQNGIHRLKTAVNDAEAIANLLEQEYKYQTIRLFPGEHKDSCEATLAEFNQLLFETLPKKIKPTEGDRLLFYFAGHGIARNSEDGPAGAMIPQDAQLGQWETYLPMKKLNQALSQLECHHLLVVLDCCFAGNFRWSSHRNVIPELETIHREHYDRFIRYPAWQAITSAAHNQEALDYTDERGIDPNSQHSPFAKALINGLKDLKADLTGDGVITAPELYLYLRDSLMDKDGLSELQTAGLWPLQKHDRGEFIFTLPGFVPEKLKPAPELKTENNPYRGLESFDEKHSELFFGRTELIEKLQEFIKDKALSIVLGASGSGKSSLVKAGLIPKLRQDETEKWCILPPIRPGETPLIALNNALTEANFLEVIFTNPQQSLASSIKNWAKDNPNTKLLLFIDQSEEIITLCQDEEKRKQFFQQILTAIDTHRDKLRVVLSLRSDFEPQVRDVGFQFIPQGYSVKQTELKNRWKNGRFMVSPMTRGELREAIQKPAEARVMFFQPQELVEEIVDEVADMPGALPLLSFALSELYLKYLARQRQAKIDGIIIERTMIQEDYQELGGVILSLTQKADEEYQKLIKKDSAYEQIIRHVMLRMIALGGGELVRRRVPLSELEYPPEKQKLVDAVIDNFTAARLLVKGKDSEEKDYVEPAHDALVSGWQKLLIWKQEYEESLLLQRRLTVAAQEWDERVRNKPEEAQKGILDKAAPVLDWLDGRLLTIESKVNEIPAQLSQVLGQLQNQKKSSEEKDDQQKSSSEKSKQFLWNGNPYLNVLNETLDSKENWLNQTEVKFVKQSTLQRRKNVSWRWRIAIAVIAGLSGLTTWSLINLRQSTINQMLTNRESAERDLQSNQLILDALIDGVSAVDFFKNHWLLKFYPPEESHKIEAVKTLRKAVYTVREYYKQSGFPSGVANIFWEKEGLLLIASTKEDGTVQVWDRQARKLAELPGSQDSVWQVSFSPDGSQLAIGTKRGAILLWDWESQRQARILQQLQCQDLCWIESLHFSQNGSQLVSVNEGIARWWDLSRNRYREFKIPQHEIKTAGFQPNDELLLVTTNSERRVNVFNSSLQKLSESKPFPMSIDGVLLSESSEKLAITYGGGRSVAGSESELWEWRQDFLRKLPARSTGINFSPDGKKLATTGFNEGTIHLQDLETRRTFQLEGHQGDIADFNFRSDGEVLASVSADGTLRLWTLENQPLSQSQPIQNKVNSLTFSSDGKLVAIQASEDRTIRLLDLSGKLVKKFNGKYPIFKNLRFSSDNQKLATLSEDGTVGILNLSNQQYREFSGEYNSESHLSFSPDSNKLAVTGYEDGWKVYVLNVSSGQIVQDFPSSQFMFDKNLIWYSNHQIILAGPYQMTRAYRSIVLLDLESGRQLQTFTEGLRRVEISDTSFNDDGSLVAFVGTHGTVHLWYMDGTKMAEFQDHDGKIESVILSPDSSMLATISEDGYAKLWKIGQLDDLLIKGCDRISDYLKNNSELEKSDRRLCDGVPSLDRNSQNNFRAYF
ncbi:MAG: caspase family protein [Cyanobacteria bacterium J06592_8]